MPELYKHYKCAISGIVTLTTVSNAVMVDSGIGRIALIATGVGGPAIHSL